MGHPVVHTMVSLPHIYKYKHESGLLIECESSVHPNCSIFASG
jgi:hypothetical protein